LGGTTLSQILSERCSTEDVYFCSQFVKNRPANPNETCRSLCIENEQYLAFFSFGTLHYVVVVKSKELTLKQIFSVPCPTCGAAIKEACELHTGARRTESHRDRKLSAAEAVERSQSKR
jgi:hypothetical protein